MFGSVGGGLIGLLAFLVMGAISLAAFAFWLWMLVHAVTNKGLSDAEKIVWVLLVIFLPFLGSVIYFFVGRPKATG
ncbi:MAG: PLD nuclease N-terminal domain-containing protein [Verrucomicrobiota bacterium]|nr:PLD nuclease N-terminal domain-containing protein [Verrucomicrobiota bacterium]